MFEAMRFYIRWVERTNKIVGTITMYGIFAMLFVLGWSIAAKSLALPALWTLDISQFLMVSYFLLGGGYSLQQDGHVRMDLLWGTLPPRKQSWVDTLTVFCMIFYIIILLYGGLGSTMYSIEYGERGFSAWRPLMWPIKVTMCVGITLMLLQAFAMLFRDILRISGRETTA
ncbi:TRAP transporter small permease subunit [Rhodovibrio salinarum]|uniref:TRAP transporter small permease protein n=1 Tax=Rhodovibrio salinarum TaxID=1087 RepID=A0A934QK10_9PROT|nr:TRAP transporter small permease subunit [Rhodovibrio salinarum]MBK1698117.1 C4-dicarboxylate ABC transporter [Rhodovibrio salinarum]